MLIDIRYHISSLAAIFLALGIGIVIGGALFGEDEVIKEQQRIISGLEQDFEKLRAERRSLQHTLKSQQVEAQVFRQFQQDIYPVLINGLLKDRKIAIVKTSEELENCYTGEICEVLQEAGADVITSIAFTSWAELKFDNQNLQNLLSEYEQEKPLSTNLLTGLAEGLALGKASRYLPLFYELKFLEYEGLPQEAVDSIVLIGGSNSKSTCRTGLIDLPLITAAREFGLTVIGVEPLNIQFSYIPQYQKAGLSSIDNIDTIPGRVALVHALVGQEKGNYGLKETAQALIPDLSINFPGFERGVETEG